MLILYNMFKGKSRVILHLNKKERHGYILFFNVFIRRFKGCLKHCRYILWTCKGKFLLQVSLNNPYKHSP